MKEWFEILNYYDEFRNVETVFLGGGIVINFLKLRWLYLRIEEFIC